MATNSSEMSLGTDGQGSPATFKVELCEYDNPVPFKVIKLEPDEAPDLSSMTLPQEPECMENSEFSKLPPSISTNLASASFWDANILKRFENEISSDESSSESDIGLNNDSDTDSESEYCDVPPETKNETVADELDIAVCDDEIKNSSHTTIQPPNLEWTSDPTSINELEFNKKQELRIPPPQTPYEAFHWFLNDEIIDTLVQETNKYAARLCKKSSISPQSRLKSWRDVTFKEMTTFLALLIHTGTIRTNMLGDYWKTDYLFNWTCFSQYIKRNRFMLILNCLNFAPPTSTRDVVGQIRPIIKNFNAKMTEIYYPGKELFLANTMILWRRRLVRQDYGKLNPSADVINLHMLAEPNGTVIKYQVYSSNINTLRAPNGKIVKELLEDYLDSGHALYTNRCYSSSILAAKLLSWRTYCTGILNKNSKDNLFTDTNSHSPKQSQSFFLNGVHIGKWHANKPVMYVSTEFRDEIQEVVEEDGSTVNKPKAIINYSKYMRDSELQEQLTSYYPYRRKSFRWNQRIFIHSLQIYMSNAYHLYNNYSGKEKLSLYDFRLAVLRAMLPEPETISVAEADAHALTKITTKISVAKRRRDGSIIKEVTEIARKKCKLCVEKQKNTDTIYECVGCAGAPGFCASCFCEFHSSRIPFSFTTN